MTTRNLEIIDDQLSLLTSHNHEWKVYQRSPSFFQRVLATQPRHELIEMDKLLKMAFAKEQKTIGFFMQ